MLHQFPASYKAPQVPFYSIKWAVMGSPGPVWFRDVCWLEYGDIIIDETGNELGFGVVCTVLYTVSILSSLYVNGDSFGRFKLCS